MSPVQPRTKGMELPAKNRQKIQHQHLKTEETWALNSFFFLFNFSYPNVCYPQVFWFQFPLLPSQEAEEFAPWWRSPGCGHFVNAAEYRAQSLQKAVKWHMTIWHSFISGITRILSVTVLQQRSVDWLWPISSCCLVTDLCCTEPWSWQPLVLYSRAAAERSVLTFLLLQKQTNKKSVDKKKKCFCACYVQEQVLTSSQSQTHFAIEKDSQEWMTLFSFFFLLCFLNYY